MNKTLLLIICDFLLLNLLALTRWEEPPDVQPTSALPTPADTARQVVEEDLVDTLRVTLEAQREEREQVGAELEQTRSALSEREESLAERERRLAALQADLERKAAEAAQLAERVQDTQGTVAQLTDRLTRAAEQAASSRAQSEQLARELAEQQAAAAQLNEQLQQAERQRTEAQERIQSLNTQVQVVETERTFLRESVDTLRTQVSAEREEKLRLQEHTGLLAEGVTQLAESSNNLRQEIRSNTPINANALFDEFLKNRLDVSFQTGRDAFLSSGNRTIDAKTILVTDGTNIVTMLEPFKFPEAVLISGGGRFYGEVEFKLDAQTPGYVRMQSRVLSRLFGEFSPSAGDLVFSKTGELLGVMVNNSYCRLVDNFIPSAELPFGTGLLDRKTSEIFAAQRARVLRLPMRLQ